MKKFLTIAALLFATLAVNAQEYKMVVYMKNHKKVEYLAKDVEGIDIVWNEHDYVDLGLSVKWATCNIGAEKPEEYGDYFAWGETEPYYTSKDPVAWKEGKEAGYIEQSYFDTDFLKYNRDKGKKVLDLEDDAAYANWGDEWRMPTDSEISELKDDEKCTWMWIESGNKEFNGVAGYKVTSRIPGYEDSFIFLPAAGYVYATEFSNQGTHGYYLSSSLGANSTLNAHYIYFISETHYGFDDIRPAGRSVRPVRSK